MQLGFWVRSERGRGEVTALLLMFLMDTGVAEEDAEDAGVDEINVS